MERIKAHTIIPKTTTKRRMPYDGDSGSHTAKRPRSSSLLQGDREEIDYTAVEPTRSPSLSLACQALTASLASSTIPIQPHHASIERKGAAPLRPSRSISESVKAALIAAATRQPGIRELHTSQSAEPQYPDGTLFAVHRGFRAGVFRTYRELKAHISGYPGSAWAIFTDMEDALRFAETGRYNFDAGKITSSMSITNIIGRLKRHDCMDLTSELDKKSCSTYPVSVGGFGDVYQGKLKNGTSIAIKTLRVTVSLEGISEKNLKRAAHELYTWSKCIHPNVHRLLGLTQFRDQLGMISQWEANGCLSRYLLRHPNIDRYGMSAQIAGGLSYLHGSGVVRGA